MHTKDEPLALAPMEIQNQPPQTAVIQELSLLCYSSMKFFFTFIIASLQPTKVPMLIWFNHSILGRYLLV